MGFQVEHECPQCGAPVALDETDHLVSCPYCGVRNYISAPNYFRFVLPHKGSHSELLYVPYLRFRGSVFVCEGEGVHHRVADVTCLGTPPEQGLPPSLGIRPQTLALKYVTPQIRGSFLKLSLKATDILAKAGRVPGAQGDGRVFHRAYIGEALSLIYLPLAVGADRVLDAVTLKPLDGGVRSCGAIGAPVHETIGWKPTFLATLCPRCGWNLEGERDSVVLICRNCHSAWAASGRRFLPLECRIIPGHDSADVYLPFWQIRSTCEGVSLDSFADFLRVTRQPRVIDTTVESSPMHFWVPAFKIRPALFLNLARRMTLMQIGSLPEAPRFDKDFFPVTLPRQEAVQSMKTVTAVSAVNKERFFPLLPRMRFHTNRTVLVYVPFTDMGHELVHRDMQVGINKRALALGRAL